MQIDYSHLPLKITKASARLSNVIHCESILQYASTLSNPHELEIIEKMISYIGLRSRCRKADVAECAGFVHDKAQEAYLPKIVQQTNNGCQQFYGKMQYPNFYSSNNNHCNE